MCKALPLTPPCNRTFFFFFFEPNATAHLAALIEEEDDTGLLLSLILSHGVTLFCCNFTKMSLRRRHPPGSMYPPLSRSSLVLLSFSKEVLAPGSLLRPRDQILYITWHGLSLSLSVFHTHIYMRVCSKTSIDLKAQISFSETAS